MNKVLILSILILISLQSIAQQDAMYTHYMYNTLSVNPAYAGTRNRVSVSALHRSQWVGFDGAPRTQTFGIHGPIIQENIGLGLSVVNDVIGPVQQSSVNADFSYKLNLGKSAKLSFGLKGGLKMLNANLKDLETYDLNDEVFAENIRQELMPNVGFGLYFYTEKFYTGISAPKLIEHKFGISGADEALLAGDLRHYFAIIGGVITLNDKWKLRPTGFVKFTPEAPLEGDITTTFFYHEKIWTGLMFRTGDAVGLLFGTFLSDKLAVGYAFDWSYANKTMRYNYGSHEIMLQYDFNLREHKAVLSPRYF